MRYRPNEYKGTAGQGVFSGSWGHADRTTSYSAYSNYIFDGLDSAKVLTGVGHAPRSSGGAATFGAFGPHVHKGLDLAMESGYGQAVPAGYANDYGRNRVNEHRGVTSSKALNV
jgi:hypothetical protein